MGGRIKVGERKIGQEQPTFIIAEAGSNHDGKEEQAHRLIDAAAEAGADAIKFQLFRAEYLYPPNVGMVETPAGLIDFYAFLEKASLPVDWLGALKRHADERGLIFLASAFDEASADALDDVGVLMHKIASPELTHLPLIWHMARTGKPLLLSTGMARLGDIQDAVDAAKGSKVILLQCGSAYPLPPQDCNLNVIPTLQAAFQTPVGFSDHTLEAINAPRAAVALGGCVIEKHFTLDRTLPGPDHPFALEPDDLKRMVEAIRATEVLDTAGRAALLGRPEIVPLLGSPLKEPAPSERELAECDRRMILVLQDVAAGEVITAKSIRILRAERNVPPGLLPKYWEVVVGARAARDLPAGRGLVWDDVIARGSDLMSTPPIQQLWEELHGQPRFRPLYPHEAVVRFLMTQFPQDEAARRTLRVLDIGCGAGRHSLLFAEQGFRTFAVDVSEPGLRVARERLGARGLSAGLEAAQMELLPFADDSFEGIVSFGVLYYNDLIGVQRAVKEIKRVLKRGGSGLVVTRTTRDYRCGKGERIDARSVRLTISETNERDMVMCFLDRADIAELFRDFSHVAVARMELTSDEGRVDSDWVITATK